MQEVNISMAARTAAKQIKLKPIFFQSSRERLRGVFEMAVREVQSVIRNNLYGDLRRYLVSSASLPSPQQQQQQVEGRGKQ
jgi:hypothetical protein